MSAATIFCVTSHPIASFGLVQIHALPRQGEFSMNAPNCAKRWLSRVLICLAIFPAITLAASDDGTLQVGYKEITFGGCFAFSGYNEVLSSGSYSPVGLTGRKTVKALADTRICDSPNIQGIISVTGFTSNPGRNWLTSVTCNGITKTGASATFTYTSNLTQGMWSWSTDFGLSSLPVGANVSCTIVHR